MVTAGQDLHCAHRITGAGGAPVRTAGDPAVVAPLPADGTRLRGIGFVDGSRASRLVRQLLDELARAGRAGRAGRAELLGVHPCGALGRLIARLADVAGGTGERRSDGLGGLVRRVASRTCRLVVPST